MKDLSVFLEAIGATKASISFYRSNRYYVKDFHAFLKDYKNIKFTFWLALQVGVDHRRLILANTKVCMKASHLLKDNVAKLALSNAIAYSNGICDEKQYTDSVFECRNKAKGHYKVRLTPSVRHAHLACGSLGIPDITATDEKNTYQCTTNVCRSTFFEAVDSGLKKKSAEKLMQQRKADCFDTIFATIGKELNDRMTEFV